MTNDKQTTSNVISAMVLSAVLLTGTLTIALPFQQSYAFTSGDSIFGHSVGGHGYIQEYNSTGSLVNEFQPDCIIVNDNCNGRGLAFDGVDLWYTVVNGTQFTGDGLIHKVARTGGADITTIPDPFGIDGRGIGALDYDFSTHTLWAISYIPDTGIHMAGNQTVFQINPADGTVLASCDVEKTIAFGAGTETLALDPNGTTFWTNAAEPELFVDEYELPNVVDQGQCVATGNSFNPTSERIGGLDFDSSGNFINSDTFGSTMYDMGTNPSDPAIDSFATTRQVEDITIVPPTGCSPGFWKTHTDETKYPNAWPSTNYAPGDDFETVFSTDLPAQYGTPTLEDALNAQGGNKVSQLLRFATATLLNADQPDIQPEEDYDEAAEIIAIVSAVDWEDKDSIKSAIQQLAPQTDFLCPISGQ